MDAPREFTSHRFMDICFRFFPIQTAHTMLAIISNCKSESTAIGNRRAPRTYLGSKLSPKEAEPVPQGGGEDLVL